MEALRVREKRNIMPFSGERLHQAITERKTSQRKLGKAINVEPSRISEYRRGVRKPEIGTVEKMADALEVPIDYLYERVGHMELISLSSDEIELVLNHRAGNPGALDDAMDAHMDGPVSDG